MLVDYINYGHVVGHVHYNGTKFIKIIPGLNKGGKRYLGDRKSHRTI
jgi:hypothetical protein